MGSIIRSGFAGMLLPAALPPLIAILAAFPIAANLDTNMPGSPGLMRMETAPENVASPGRKE